MDDILSVISSALSLSKDYIEEIVYGSDYYYRDFLISKVNGGSRKISQPSPELKTFQYWIVKNIICLLPVSEFCYSYRRGLSIKDNALVHYKNNRILHMDIENFFESITNEHIKRLLVENCKLFENKDFNILDSIDVINKICLRRNKMCIGAVSSPAISNAILFRFDEEMKTYCEENNLKYSRYADDMYISSNKYIDYTVVDIIKTSLKKYDFKINDKKTRFMSTKGRRTVTGLILTNDKKVSIGLSMKNNIKKMIYQKIMHNIGERETILGYLAYIKDIEPAYYNKLITKYSKYGDIFKALDN